MSLSIKIIESVIDIPNVNTLNINKDVMRSQIKNIFELPERLLEFIIDISASIIELFEKV